MDKEWDDIVDFNNKYMPKWKFVRRIFYSNALAGEVGEVCGKVKKYYGGGTNKENVTDEDIAEECVDVYIYLVMLLESMDINKEQFSKCITIKINKLFERMKNV